MAANKDEILDAKKRFTICAGGPLRGPRVHGREAVTRPSPAVFDDGRRREHASHSHALSRGIQRGSRQRREPRTFN